MRAAQRVEDKKAAQKNRMGPYKYTKAFQPIQLGLENPGVMPAKAIEAVPIRSITLPNAIQSVWKDTPIKPLSNSELQARKPKGLCYRCNEMYIVGHPCKGKEMLLLMVDNEMLEEIDDMTMDTVPSKEETTEVAKLSLNTMVGTLTPTPWRLKEKSKWKKWSCG